jgi:hypothetical protein
MSWIRRRLKTGAALCHHLYVLEFDLLAPPYDQVNQVTVSEMNELNANMQISTGKRLGFRFQADDEVTIP